MPGVFITLEGGDGTGKSTQAEMLTAWLEDNWPAGVVTTREPGGTVGADEIRKLTVKENNFDWDSLTEALLMTAARRDHVRKVIEPALAAGKAVISDRFFHSTLAYQGRGDNPASLLEQLNAHYLDGIEPDIVILLDLDPDIALARSKGGDATETHFENRGGDFQREVRDAFLSMADRRFMTISIDEEDTPDTVHEKIITQLAPRLEKMK